MPGASLEQARSANLFDPLMLGDSSDNSRYRILGFASPNI